MSVHLHGHKAGLTISSDLYCNADCTVAAQIMSDKYLDVPVAISTFVALKLKLLGSNTVFCMLLFVLCV